MRVLRGGGSAVEAVEAAIRVLEDKEITNAGYGSNLTIEGVVECDATVVDHLGRSGACGAVASKFFALLGHIKSSPSTLCFQPCLHHSVTPYTNRFCRDQESDPFGSRHP